MPRIQQIDRWNEDPEYSALPAPEKQAILENYFDKNLADSDYQNLPSEERASIRSNFSSYHMPTAPTPPIEQPQQPEETTREQIGRLGARAGDVAAAGLTGMAEGVTTELPGMVGGAMEFVGSGIPGDITETMRETTAELGGDPARVPDFSLDVLRDVGKDLKDWAEAKKLQWYGPPKKRKGLKRIVYEGSKMLAPSILPGAIVGKGIRVLSGVGKLVKAAKAAEIGGNVAKAAELMDKANKAANMANNIASAATASMFGLSQAQQTKDTAEEQAVHLEAQGKFDEAKKVRASGQGPASLGTGIIEAAGEYYGTKYLGKLFRLDEAGVAKRGAKNLVKDFMKTLGVEVSTEVGQQVGQAGIEKITGIRPEADPIAEALDVVGPTVFMTLLTGGLSGAIDTKRESTDSINLLEDVTPEKEPVNVNLIKRQLKEFREEATGPPSTAEEAAWTLLDKEEEDRAQLQRLGIPGQGYKSAEFSAEILEDAPEIAGRPLAEPITGPPSTAQESAETLVGPEAVQEELERERIEREGLPGPKKKEAGQIERLGLRVPEIKPAEEAARVFEEEEYKQPEFEYLAEEEQPPAPSPVIAPPPPALAEKEKVPEKEEIDVAANEAATSPLNAVPQPTEAQKEAGNYLKGKVSIQGLDISIENPKGSVRSGKDSDGETWETKMKSHYGYIKGTVGKDKDHIDIFVGDNPNKDTVYVVDQINPDTGEFDEHKALIGFKNMITARKGYRENYEKGWKGLGAITKMPVEEFKEWAGDKEKTKLPLKYKETKRAAQIRRAKGEVLPAEERKLEEKEQPVPTTPGEKAPLRQQPEEGRPDIQRPEEVGRKSRDRLKKGKKAFNPETDSVSKWVRQQGGFSSKGEFRGELISGVSIKESRAGGLINNKTGLLPDRMRERAVEEGWINEDVSASDFIDIVSKDFTASKTGDKSGQTFHPSKEEFEVPVPSEEEPENVPVGDLKVGDKFEIRGEEHTVVGEDKEGKLIIKNGITIKADVFDTVPVDKGMEGVKSKTKEEAKPKKKKGKTQYSVASDLGFYSAVEKAVEAMDFKKIPANDLANRVNKLPGIKAEELEHLGLIDWLEGMGKDKVTKDQVTEFIKAGGVQLEEITYDKGRLTKRAAPKFEKWQMEGSKENYREVLLTLPVGKGSGKILTRRDYAQQILIPKYGADYLVDKYRWTQKEEREYLALPGGDVVDRAFEVETSKQVFRGSHFDEANILAHVRLNDRVDEDGKKTLFIEEIQSDWHQKGRKEGYKAKEKAKPEDFRVEKILPKIPEGKKPKDYEPYYRVYHEPTGAQYAPPNVYSEDEALSAAIQIHSRSAGVIPDAPFKSSWPLLAFKRVLRMASEQGYDAIAWTPGEVQADRYDLSKQISKIDWGRNDNGTYDVSAVTKAPEKFVTKRQLSHSDIEEFIGKELTKRIIEDKKDEGIIEGVDLKVGGEGMKAFYDKMLPNIVGKYVKKLDKKSMVETAEMGGVTKGLARKIPLYSVWVNRQGYNSEQYTALPETKKDALRDEYEDLSGQPSTQEVWSLPLTDKLKESVMGGQPLFKVEKGKREVKPERTIDIVESVFPGQEIKENETGFEVTLKNGVKVQVERTGTIEPEPKQLAAWGMKELGEGDAIAGVYIRKGGKAAQIKIVTAAGKNVLHHESIHLLEDFGVITKLEAGRINRHIRQKGLWEQSITGAENRANWLADEANKPAPTSRLGKIWDKIKTFVGNLVNKLGIRTVGGITRDIKTGKIFEKEAVDPGKTLMADDKMYSKKGEVLTDTPAFENWFGKSQVVDEKGKPLVVFHGTTNDFKEFARSSIGKNYGQRFAKGFYFTESKNIADAYKNELQKKEVFGGKVIPVFLSLQNPVIVNSVPEYRSKLEEIKNKIATNRFERDQLRSKDDSEIFQQAGYDGVIYKNDRGEKEEIIAFEPTQIKSVSNKGTFDPQDPNIYYSVERTGEPTEESEEQPGLLRRQWDEIVYNMQDKFNYLNKAQMEAKRKSRAELPEEQDAYLAETRYHGMAAAAIEDFQEEYVDPMLELMSSNDIDIGEADEYLHARHAKEANARLKEINPDRPDNETLSGMTDEEAESILLEVNDSPQSSAYKELGGMVDRVTKAQRDILLSSEQESPETIKQWKDTYDFYVPLMREGKAEGKMPRRGRGFDIRGKQKIRAGSTRGVINILAHTVANAEAAMIRAEKAKVARTFLEFARNNEGPWKIDTVEYKPSFNAEGIIEYRPDPLYRDADNVMVVKEGGVNHRIVFDESNLDAMRIASAMKNLDAGDSGRLVNVLSKATRWLAMVNTSLNPEFIISNFFRDIQTAGYNMSDSDADKVRLKSFKDIKSSWRGIRDFQKGKKSTEWAKWYNQYRKAGAQVGWAENYRDIIDREKKMISEIKNMRPGKALTIKRGLNSVMKFIEQENSAVENAVRLSVFKNLIENGVPESKAASIAKELTVNFNRKGAMGQAMNALYLFYNASIQGSTRLISAATKSPKVRKMMVGTVAFSAGLDILNRAVGGVDDDGEDRYDKIAPWVKERNMIFMLPGGKGYVQIPLPWGYNIFHVMGQTAGEAVTKKDFKPWDGASRIAGATVSSFNPVGGEASILQVLSPSLTDPIVQWAENKNWAGRKLRPDANVFTPRPSSQTYWSSVREPSKQIAAKLNELTGGDAIKPGKIDISPEAIDLAINTFTGSAGKFVGNLISAPIKLAKGEELEAYEIPIGRRVYGRIGKQALTSEFYENMDSVQLVKRQLEHFQGDNKKLKEITTNSSPEKRSINRMIAAKKSLTALRKLKKSAVENIKNKKMREKRLKSLNEKIKLVMNNFNKHYKKQKREE